MINILIGTPAYNATVSSQYTSSLISTCLLLKSMNIEFNVHFINNQIVTRARNMIAHIFMTGDYSHLMFIDADIIWQPDDIVKLLNHEKECVIGIYPNKGYTKSENKMIVRPSSQIIENDPSKVYFYNENLVNIKRAATGFMMLTKAALERIQPDIEQFYLPCGDEVFLLYNYFNCMVVEKDYLTEDFYFSHLYLKNGGQIFADKTISLLHVGIHEYGSLA